MTLLIIGANGQVGSAIRRLGTMQAISITALGSRDLDIGDRQAVLSAIQYYKPAFLVNAAAYTAVDKAEQQGETAQRVNAEGPGWLAEAANKSAIPLLHFSTDYVFDGTLMRPYREEDAVSPMGVYGATKLAGEKAIRERHARHLIFRTSWVFGLEGHNFPKVMLRLAAERPEIGVVDDQTGCPTFADHLASMVLAVFQRYQAQGRLEWGTYHYAGSRACTWFDFASHILEKSVALGLLTHCPRMKRLTTAEYPTPARRPANSRLDCGKFQSHFPEIPLSDWERGVDVLLEDIKSGRPK